LGVAEVEDPLTVVNADEFVEKFQAQAGQKYKAEISNELD
jgi:hypothetical protein